MTLSRTATTTAQAGRQGDGLSREILVLAGGVILGTIMTVLDLTVVNVAIPTLGSDLNAPIPAAQSRATARRLRQAGLSGRDIAKVLNVSPQRVSQLLRTGT